MKEETRGLQASYLPSGSREEEPGRGRVGRSDLSPEGQAPRGPRHRGPHLSPLSLPFPTCVDGLTTTPAQAETLGAGPKASSSTPQSAKVMADSSSKMPHTLAHSFLPLWFSHIFALFASANKMIVLNTFSLWFLFYFFLLKTI